MSFDSISIYVNELISAVGVFCSSLPAVSGSELSSALVSLFLNAGVGIVVFLAFAFPFIVIYHLIRFIARLTYD